MLFTIAPDLLNQATQAQANFSRSVALKKQAEANLSKKQLRRSGD